MDRTGGVGGGGGSGGGVSVGSGGGAGGLRKVCMNVKCGKSSSINWKPGWYLRSGRPCELCEGCGSVFEQGRFCEAFHSDDAGWRTCNSCKKRVHCGCIASLYSFVLLDAGGVECQACASKSTPGMPFKLVQHLVPPLPPPAPAAPVTAVRPTLDPSVALRPGWGGEALGSKVVRPTVDVGTTWRPSSSAWHAPNNGGLSIGRPTSAEASERLVEGTSTEPVTKVVPRPILGGRAEESLQTVSTTTSKFIAPAPKDGSTSTENIGDSLDVDRQMIVESNSVGGYPKEAALAGASDPGQGGYHHDGMQIGSGSSIGTKGPVGLPDVADDDGVNYGKGNPEQQPRGARVGNSKSLLSKIQEPYGSGPSTGLTMAIGIPLSKEGNNDGNQQQQSGGLVGGLSAGLGTNVATGVTSESKDLVSKFSNGLSPYRSRQRHLLPRLYNTSAPPPVNTTDVKSSDAGSLRVARPPGQGRGRNQLLPRYWPRITDQELQQITSGDSNTTITPLFEKMLSASDAGRIGRLVLPKACAEAYFPTISQPEGLPMRIQDITGKEWIFQFRFWPNNNSRMYVLEGVTPCIQSMQLQAGDTVTFSRLEPEGKLVMGYRRAPASLTSQVDRKRGRPLGGKSKRLRMENEDSVELKTSWEEAQELLRPPPSVVPTVVTIEGHDFEEYEEPPVCTKRTIFASRQSGEQDQWAQCDDCGCWRRVPYDALVPSRWTCSENTWDRTRASCSMPQEINGDDVDNLLGLVPGEDMVVADKGEAPSAPTPSNSKVVVETSGGLDALANAAALGDTGRMSSSPSSPARTTTKHPRHRPGCTCIVCIQPPSGKGPKHKQNCLCNVCVTVKRRFKTLMMRRKKRITDRETDGYIRRKRKDDVEVSSASGSKLPVDTAAATPKHESSSGATTTVVERPRRLELGSTSGEMKDMSGMTTLGLTYGSSKPTDDISVGKGQIDLNSQPEREEEPCKVSSSSHMSMRQLLHNASLPLDTYLKEQGMKNLFGSPSAAETSNAGASGGHGGSSSEKKSEQSSSQCQEHQSIEEASQTSTRAHGDGPSVAAVVPSQTAVGAQTPVQVHSSKLAIPEATLSLLQV